MTLNRLITTIIQLAFGVPVIWYATEAYKDIKENGLFPKEENEDVSLH